MSKYNNVNPDHYKVRGRERPHTLAAVEQQQAPKEKDLRPPERYKKRLQSKKQDK
jgi:hypothetical protein